MSGGNRKTLFHTFLKRDEAHDIIDLAKESVMDITREGVLVLDKELNVLYANQTVLNRYPTIMHLETEREREQLARLVKVEDSVFEKSGFCVEVHVSRLADEGMIKGYLIRTFDLSEKNACTSEIEALKEAAELAKQEKNALITTMSHEIRTPMTAIMENYL